MHRSAALVGQLILGFCLIVSAAAAGDAYQSETITNQGSIDGTVRYGGSPPKPALLDISKDRNVCGTRPVYDPSLIVGKKGGVANAVVTLPDLDHGIAMRPKTNVTFDQKSCEYVPHVAVFPAGSMVDVINSDGILHNIHTESTINPVIDMAQPGFKKMIKLKLEKPEAIKVTCDAHNWMEGWWYVTGNPYYALTGTDGHYQIDGIPAGTYKLEAWQEKLGVQTRTVTVKSGATTNMDFVMSAKVP